MANGNACDSAGRGPLRRVGADEATSASAQQYRVTFACLAEHPTLTSPATIRPETRTEARKVRPRARRIKPEGPPRDNADQSEWYGADQMHPRGDVSAGST